MKYVGIGLVHGYRLTLGHFVPAGKDYVLIARPGLPEAVQAQGFDWLQERVDEVLQKAAA